MHTQVTQLLERTDDELSAMLEAGDIDLPTVEAVCEAQDQAARNAERARERRAARYVTGTASEWYEAAYAQYRDAERATGGYLLSRLGGDEGITEPMVLWTGREEWAMARASEELRNYWMDHPRMTVTEYERQARAGIAEIRDEQTEAPVEEETQAAPRTQEQIREDVQAAWKRNHEKIRAEHEAAMAASGGAVAKRDSAETEAPKTGTIVPSQGRPDAPVLLRRALEEMGILITDYVEFPSRSAVIAVVLWIAQAACRDSDGDPIWRAFVRLLLTSRLNGSGKSTLADFVRWLLACRAGRASKITPYGLCKVLGKLKETAIADDAQNVFRSDKAGSELLTVLINGYTHGATWITGKGDGSIEDAFGPVVIVGKDELMTKRREYLRDLIDRSVVIRMERPARYMPEVDQDAEDRARSLGLALKAVTGALQSELKQAARDLAADNAGRANTDGDGGRTAQIWRPLLAVARVADTGTGRNRWEDAARQAMSELSAASGDLLQAEEALAALETASAALGTGERSFWGDED